MRSKRYTTAVDSKGIIQTFKILDYYADKTADFIFDKCKSLEGVSRLYLPTPRLPYIEDQIHFFDVAPLGSQTYSYKERQIQWTHTHVKCIVHRMLTKNNYTSFWFSTVEDTAADVIDRAKNVVNHFDFYVPVELKQFTYTSWEIEKVECKFIAFTSSPTNITGKYPDDYTLDEVTKYKPQSKYEEAKKEAIAACQTGRIWTNSTALTGNSFEHTIVAAPKKGLTHEDYLKTFWVPTRTEWLAAKRAA